MHNNKILVWDIPTRLFHWLLALSFVMAYITAEEEQWQNVHITAGYTLLGLLVFRLVWGFVGTRYARFSDFLYRPAQICTYVLQLFKRTQHYIGHNPLGSVAVFLLLGLGFLTTISGYFLVTFDGDLLEEVHEFFANAMLFVVVVHIVGVVVSSKLYRENLARAMVTGYKQGDESAGITRKYLIIGVLLLVTVVGFWFYAMQHPFVGADENENEVISNQMQNQSARENKNHETDDDD